MDSRCPRNLTEYPCERCDLAVLRLKAINSYREIPGVVEDTLPGCKWACLDQLSCYCSFLYMERNKGREASISEIANLLLISQKEVEEILKSTIKKLKRASYVKDYRKNNKN